MSQDKKTDQASTVSTIHNQESVQASSPVRVMSITSGKGGVGKTNIVSNLAFLFSKLGKNVFILDADVGLANIDVLLGLAPEYNLQHVMNGEKSIADIVVEGPGGIKIFPASSGIQELSELTQEQKLLLLSEFDALKDNIDILLVDTGAGISSNVMYFNMAAQEKVVVVTPEPTSITDAYAIMKVMSKKYGVDSFNLIVNEVNDEHEAMELYNNLNSVADKFLNIIINYLGHVVLDPNMTNAVRQQKLVTTLFPDSPASLCFVRLAKKILEREEDIIPTGNIGFFWNNLLEQGS